MKVDKYTDVVGIASAVLCIIHCFAIPALMLWYSMSEKEPWYMLDGIFVAVSGIAVAVSAANSPLRTVKIGLWASYGIFVGSIFLHHLVDFALYISLAGSVLLLIFHMINFRVHHKKHHSFANYS